MPEINCYVNGELKNICVDYGETLLMMLRNRLGLTGVKKGCEVGECGACTVLVDGKPVTSCIYLALWVDGKNVLTVEGLTASGELSSLQQSFVEEGAVQCGFCIPGFLMSAYALLKKKKHPTETEIRNGIAGNFCRCTGYENIIRAIKNVNQTSTKAKLP